MKYKNIYFPANYVDYFAKYDILFLVIEMINRLISDIKNYISYLDENKIYLSIHTDFTEYMLPLLEYNIHKNPKCLIVKSDNESWERCIRVHSSESHHSVGCTQRTCFAGVLEDVFYLGCGGTVCASTDDGVDSTAIKTLIMPLCRMIEYLKAISPENNSEATENELVNRAVKFIQRNFYNRISNEDIASYCSCSVSSLCHLFKDFMGVSVHSYICDLRLSYARELLKTSNLSVTSIAHKSGFSDYNYFTVKFKKLIGVSPSAYRIATKKG